MALSLTRVWEMYDGARSRLKDGTIDLAADAFKAALLPSSHDPDPSTHQTRSDISGDIIGTDQTLTTSSSTSSGRTTWTLDGDVSWDGAVSPRYVATYDDTADNKPLLTALDLGGTQVVPSGGTFTFGSGDVFTKAIGALAEVSIPASNDWTDQGQAFAPAAGAWDARLSAGTPGTIVKKDGTYYAYYVGADGNREDGGPANRAVGLVTSTNGTSWSKSGSNPVIPYSALNSNNDDEEGAWRLCVFLDGDTFLMYISRLTGSGGTVAGPVYLFTSSDGVSWTDQGQIIDPEDASFPGSDEFAAHGAVHDGETYHFFYGGKGSQSYALDHTSASTRDGFSSGTELLEDTPEFRYGSNPVRISETEWIVPVGEYTGGDIRLYRTSTLGTLGTLAETWTGLDAEEGNFALYLDRATSTWILLLATSTDETADDWDEVRVWTTSVTEA